NIVQRGTPEDVYFRSNSRFVTDFMGKANFIKATVIGGADEHELLVDSAVGQLRCEAAPGTTIGQAGPVAVRMEFVEILDQAIPAELPANHAVGTVLAATFLGETREVEVEAGTERLTLRVPSTVTVVPDQQV